MNISEALRTRMQCIVSGLHRRFAGAVAKYAVLDAGWFLMAMLLSASSHSVQSCAQAVLASYPDLVRARYDVGEEWHLLCGVALGYQDGHVVNTFRPARAPRSEIVLPRR